jgi:hypothetical protein
MFAFMFYKRVLPWGTRREVPVFPDPENRDEMRGTGLSRMNPCSSRLILATGGFQIPVNRRGFNRGFSSPEVAN